MLTLKVWLLVISTSVYSGEVTSVQPQMYPTVQDCQQVQKNLPSSRGVDYYNRTRCIETNVMVAK